MTAEIAILNRNGVGLAADSAVTIDAPDGTKVYNTVNKLFALSTHAPVAAMVYGRAELTRVPWETIIKVYRRQLADKRFPHLKDYAENLIAFLDSTNDLFPEWQQRSEFLASLDGFCRMLLRDIDQRIQQHLAAGQGIDTTKIESIVTDVVTEQSKFWSRASYLPGRAAAFADRIVRTWSSDIDKVINDFFGKLKPTPATMTKLRRLAGQLFAKNVFCESIAGLVIAGYGEREHFPSLVSYELEGVVLDRLKCRAERDVVIGSEAESCVVPLAQREMVDLFMQGIDPIFLSELRQIVQGVLNGMPGLVLNSRRLRKSDKRAVERRMAAASKILGEQFSEWLKGYATNNHVNPVIGSVSTLPKEELGAMAEALVNLTSFKRRVTHDVETVGGPIDVAVISKGDGFVWIKRKHYFDSALNPQFMAKYSR